MGILGELARTKGFDLRLGNSGGAVIEGSKILVMRELRNPHLILDGPYLAFYGLSVDQLPKCSCKARWLARTDGSVIAKDRGRIRLGTRFVFDGKRSYCVADLIKAGGGIVGEDELIRVGDSAPVPFLWDQDDTLPRPEDFVLTCSDTTLEDIYKAAEWEGQRPHMPAPIVMDGGPVQPLSQTHLAAMSQRAAGSRSGTFCQPTQDHQPQTAQGDGSQAAQNNQVRQADGELIFDG